MIISRNLKLSLTILCVLLIVIGLGGQIYSTALSISNYPLPTGWSESGRLFEAATIYSPLVFGKTLPWPWLDPGRAILEGLVFLIPNSQIWMYRFWTGLLGLLAASFSALLIIKRIWNKTLRNKFKTKTPLFVLLVGWGILYILQFPIQAHLLLGAIFVLWLFDLDKPIYSLIIIVIASAWEGLCRVNWFLMPAVLGITIYFLSVAVTGKNPFRYLLWPVIWTVGGTLSSFLAYGIFIKISNYVIPFYNSNMHYGFFRNRLWPNADFSLGLIPGIILLSAPLIILILALYLRIIHRVHWIRIFALLGILGIFFIGSTIVSTRAGGGFDLHNYDLFGLILFIIGCYFGLGAVNLDKPEPGLPEPWIVNRLIMLGLLSVPLFFTLSGIPRPTNLPVQAAKNSIQQLQMFIQKTDTSKGPILFIDNRQLLVYHMIPNVVWYVPYEKIELMEMAIANNNPYLNQFWKDIKGHRFSLIVAEKLQLAKQDINLPLGYENNVWVAGVSDPILRYYQLTYQGPGFAIYLPLPEAK